MTTPSPSTRPSAAVNPAAYLLVLLWLALCQAFFTTSASPLVEEGSHVDGAIGVAKALAPSDDLFSTLRRAAPAQDDPPDQSPDPAIFHVFTLPVLTLAAAFLFFLRRLAPLAPRRRSATPRAPPVSFPH
jgi:hypothetical protein